MLGGVLANAIASESLTPRLCVSLGCRITRRASSMSGMSAGSSGQTWTPAKSPRVLAWLARRLTISV